MSCFQLLKELSISECEFPHFGPPFPCRFYTHTTYQSAFCVSGFQSPSLSQLTFSPEQPPVPGPLSGCAALRVLEEAKEEEHQHGDDQPRPRRHPPSESWKSYFPRTSLYFQRVHFLDVSPFSKLSNNIIETSVRDFLTVTTYSNGCSWMNMTGSVAHLSVYILNTVPQLDQ